MPSFSRELLLGVNLISVRTPKASPRKNERAAKLTDIVQLAALLAVQRTILFGQNGLGIAHEEA